MRMRPRTALQAPFSLAQTEQQVNAYVLYTYVMEAPEKETCCSFYFLLEGQAVWRRSIGGRMKRLVPWWF